MGGGKITLTLESIRSHYRNMKVEETPREEEFSEVNLLDLLLLDLLFELDEMNFSRWKRGGEGLPTLREENRHERAWGECMYLILHFYPMQVSFVIYLCHF